MAKPNALARKGAGHQLVEAAGFQKGHARKLATSNCTWHLHFPRLPASQTLPGSVIPTTSSLLSTSATTGTAAQLTIERGHWMRWTEGVSRREQVRAAPYGSPCARCSRSDPHSGGQTGSESGLNTRAERRQN